MKKKYVRFRIGIILMITLAIFLLTGCNDGPILNASTDYLSITSTTYIDPNTEEMTTSIHKYIPSTGELNKVFSFPYTSQYPLGVLSSYDNTVYYTKRDSSNRDQIYSYNLDTNEEVQLTTELRAVNQIIPTSDKIFFIASLDRVLRLGVLDKMNNIISYWGDEDTNVETMVINPNNQKIYLSVFSYSKDRENIENQFISGENQYKMPLFSIYETDYTFTETKEMFSACVWIRNLLVNFTNNSVVAIYDEYYNSDEVSKAIAIDTSSDTIEDFDLPPQRMQVDGGSFSKDGEGLYVISEIGDKRGIYYYNFVTKEYTPIFITEDEFVNNFLFIQD